MSDVPLYHSKGSSEHFGLELDPLLQMVTLPPDTRVGWFPSVFEWSLGPYLAFITASHLITTSHLLQRPVESYSSCTRPPIPQRLLHICVPWTGSISSQRHIGRLTTLPPYAPLEPRYPHIPRQPHLCAGHVTCRSASPIRKHHPAEPCSRNMPRLLWRSYGGLRFLMGEVPL